MLVLLSLINNKDLTCNPLFKYKLITNNIIYFCCK